MNSQSNVRVLIVDDEAAICKVLSDSLKDEGFETQTAEDGLTGLSKIKSYRPHIVLLDIWMPGEIDGLDVLQQAKLQNPDVQFIIMSGHGTIETAVKATKLGAWDFVEKPLSIDKILILINNIVSFNAQKSEKENLLNRLRKNLYIVGASEKMVSLKHMISRLAPTHSWVLISGERGVGKNLLAHNIHYLSSRSGGPLVELKCPSISPELMESELFGYSEGAFTGEHKEQKGKLDAANGGTLILSEISELSETVQAKLLNFIQERSFTRVNGTLRVHSDVRLIAITSRDLQEEIDQGRFSQDLYYRLSVFPLKVPTLKERKEDIPMLIQHFSNQFVEHAGISSKPFTSSALEILEEYTWPGNVRELQNFVERLYILSTEDIIDEQDLYFAGLNVDGPMSGDSQANFRDARARFEKDFLLKAIDENNGNITKTAEFIGLERSYLHRKIKSYGIDV